MVIPPAEKMPCSAIVRGSVVSVLSAAYVLTVPPIRLVTVAPIISRESRFFEFILASPFFIIFFTAIL